MNAHIADAVLITLLDGGDMTVQRIHRRVCARIGDVPYRDVRSAVLSLQHRLLVSMEGEEVDDQKIVRPMWTLTGGGEYAARQAKAAAKNAEKLGTEKHADNAKS